MVPCEGHLFWATPVWDPQSDKILLVSVLPLVLGATKARVLPYWWLSQASSQFKLLGTELVVISGSLFSWNVRLVVIPMVIGQNTEGRHSLSFP